jgi:hypothetical protein
VEGCEGVVVAVATVEPVLVALPEGLTVEESDAFKLAVAANPLALGSALTVPQSEGVAVGVAAPSGDAEGGEERLPEGEPELVAAALSERGADAVGRASDGENVPLTVTLPENTKGRDAEALTEPLPVRVAVGVSEKEALGRTVEEPRADSEREGAEVAEAEPEGDTVGELVAAEEALPRVDAEGPFVPVAAPPGEPVAPPPVEHVPVLDAVAEPPPLRECVGETLTEREGEPEAEEVGVTVTEGVARPVAHAERDPEKDTVPDAGEPSEGVTKGVGVPARVREPEGVGVAPPAAGVLLAAPEGERRVVAVPVGEALARAVTEGEWVGVTVRGAVAAREGDSPPVREKEGEAEAERGPVADTERLGEALGEGAAEEERESAAAAEPVLTAEALGDKEGEGDSAEERLPVGDTVPLPQYELLWH